MARVRESPGSARLVGFDLGGRHWFRVPVRRSGGGSFRPNGQEEERLAKLLGPAWKPHDAAAALSVRSRRAETELLGRSTAASLPIEG
jgi:hypothetical protein